MILFNAGNVQLVRIEQERQVVGTGEARANVLLLYVISCCIFKENWWCGDTINFAEGWKFVLRRGKVVKIFGGQTFFRGGG